MNKIWIYILFFSFYSCNERRYYEFKIVEAFPEYLAVTRDANNCEKKKLLYLLEKGQKKYFISPDSQILIKRKWDYDTLCEMWDYSGMIHSTRDSILMKICK